MQVDELNLEEPTIGVQDSTEAGSATRTLLFGDTESFDDLGVAMKITRDTVYLTVNGIDEFTERVIKAHWEMPRNELIHMLMSVEGN